MKKFFALACLLTASHFSSAQFSDWQWVPTNYSYYYFKNTTHVCSVTQSYAFLCFASTDSGLSKITSLNFYYNNPIYPPLDSALSGNEITALSKDLSPGGNIPILAIGTTHGLYLWDLESSYTYFNSANSPLPNDTINFIYQNGDNFWLCTNGGLATYFNSNGAWDIYNTSNSPLPSNHINCIEQGFLNYWIGTDSGIAIKNNSSWKILNTTNSGLADNDITALYFVDDNHWIGTRSKGLCDSTTSGNWLYLNSNNGLPSDSINFIEKDWNNWWPHNGFIVGTNGAGLLACQDSTEFVAQLDSLDGLPIHNAYDLSFNSCMECLEAWIGTDNGILYSVVIAGDVPSISGNANNIAGYFENDVLHVEFNSSSSKKVTIGICDLIGRNLLAFEKTVQPGKNNIIAPTRNFIPGIYLLTCISENEVISLKLLKHN